MGETITMENQRSIPSESAIKAPSKGRLTAAFVRSVNRPGVYCDQHGLRLRVYESRKLKSISKRGMCAVAFFDSTTLI